MRQGSARFAQAGRYHKRGSDDYADQCVVRRRTEAVAISRAMHFDSDLIILDEPTNNLGVEETKGVLRFVRSARDSGHSCILIAHNIYHVFQVVDRIIVLRRGKKVADDIDPKQTTMESVESIITGMMIGA